MVQTKFASKILNVASPVKHKFLIGLVGLGVGVGVGVDVGNIVDVKDILVPAQFIVTVGVNVGVGVGVKVYVGVTVCVGVTSQFNNASKSNTSQAFVVVVVVAQSPAINSSHKSGHAELQGVLPNKIHVPPNELDKHHLIPSKNINPTVGISLLT